MFRSVPSLRMLDILTNNRELSIKIKAVLTGKTGDYTTVNQVFEELSRVMNAWGVDSLTHNGLTITYVKNGNPHNLTLVYEHRTESVFVSSWGSYLVNFWN